VPKVKAKSRHKYRTLVLRNLLPHKTTFACESIFEFMILFFKNVIKLVHIKLALSGRNSGWRGRQPFVQRKAIAYASQSALCFGQRHRNPLQVLHGSPLNCPLPRHTPQSFKSCSHQKQVESDCLIKAISCSIGLLIFFILFL
jgi:hypothetical protein